MKKFFVFALTCLLMASCASDEFDGQTSNKVKRIGDGELSFSMETPNVTRATSTGAEAAKKLNYNFVTYGFKNVSGAEQADASTDECVFDLYNVNYVANSAGTTKSNTSNWEYVGYKSLKDKDQTIKYWDYDAKQYVFSAVSGVGLKAEKILSGTTIYDKGWKVTVPAGGSLIDFYASARKPMTKSLGAEDVYNYEIVNLKFFSVATKIRFALYETVPGYSVSIDSFFYDNLSVAAPNNFAIDGKFKVLDNSKEATLYVTYNDNTTDIENQPKVSYNDADVAITDYKLFGTNMQAQAAIGESSKDATFDQDGGAYTVILPFQGADNNLKLKVNYTLTSTDGSGEKIHVKNATAIVPTQYTQWKNNFAYTYLFKISDNSNGSTGSDPKDPKGLYPITFDACVADDAEGLQETVTSVASPSITTYQNGAVVNEYKAGDIYYVANDTVAGVVKAQDLTASKVYEVYYTGKAPITEALVANYATNDVTLIPVTTTEATEVPQTDGAKITFPSGKCYKFKAVAGKTYAIYTTKGWKVVKVEGAYSAPAFTMTAYAGTISETTGKATLLLNSGYARVTGAIPSMKVYNSASEDVTDNFVIAESATNAYTFQLTQSAISAGANDTYTVKFATDKASCNFTVALTYTLSPASSIAVIAGKSNTFTLAAGSVPVVNALVKNCPDGVTIEETATAGTYKVSAEATAAGGNYNVTVAGQAYQITVTSFSFAPSTLTLVWAEGAAAPEQQITLSSVTAAVTVASSTPAVVAGGSTDASGKFNVVALSGGKTNLTYENAKCAVTVNKYEMTANVNTFKKATGKAYAYLECNGEKVIPTAAKAHVYYKADSSVASWGEITTGFTLSAVAKSLQLANVVKAGLYLIQYYDGSTVIGNEQFTVTD